jgi:ribonuclease E
MAKRMLINVVEDWETRVAIVEENHLQELYIERVSDESERHVGDIFRGRVTNVEPAMQAAFVDYGGPRNGFLHASELAPVNFLSKAREEEAKPSGRSRPYVRIEEELKRGQEIVVQMQKEELGGKGPRLTSYVSLAGRYLVLTPASAHLGVSRKIESEAERSRLKELLEQLTPPKNLGFIVRTAGQARTKTDLRRDLSYLLRLWKVILARMRESATPSLIYQESDLVIRCVRDLYNPDIQEILVDSEAEYQKVREFIQTIMPRQERVVKLYRGAKPIFEHCQVDKELESIAQREVPLPSGGALVIDETEALVAIDVNTRGFRHGRDPEQTALRTDLEAAAEVARQLRLRDLGGVIVVDFIDLKDAEHRRQVERALAAALKGDRARLKTLRMNNFGLIELTRQRVRPSLTQSMLQPCSHCGGRGYVKAAELVAMAAMAELERVLKEERVARVEVALAPEVAGYLLNQRRRALVELEDQLGKRVAVRGDAAVAVDSHKMLLFDQGGNQLSPKRGQ